MKTLYSILLSAVVLFGSRANAQSFETSVSQVFSVPNVVSLSLVNSSMDISWFVERDGDRTIYSNDVVVGTLVGCVQGHNSISAHATWVINYDSATRTVNIKKDKTHITNWYLDQRCHVYENGTCNCGTNPNWTYCAYPPMSYYVATLQCAAILARINARIALQQAGYTVTNNP